MIKSNLSNVFIIVKFHTLWMAEMLEHRFSQTNTCNFFLVNVVIDMQRPTWESYEHNDIYNCGRIR